MGNPGTLCLPAADQCLPASPPDAFAPAFPTAVYVATLRGDIKKEYDVIMPLPRILIASLLSTCLITGCSQPSQQEITVVREPGNPPKPAPRKASAAQRLQLEASQGLTFHVDVPAGWEQVPTTEFRQVNLRMTDTPEAECYFTLLPGGGGGLEANINRWRAQMGMEPLSADEIVALPKKSLMFGQPATFVDLQGTFSGMGAAPQEDYRMYGLILHHTNTEGGPDQAFFLKMTGPNAALAGQEANFDKIAASLHAVMPGEEHSHDHDHGAPAATSEQPEPDSQPATEAPQAVENPHAAAAGEAAHAHFHWTTPTGWEEREGGMMRQINLTITDHPEVECYLTELEGTGGGLEMNLNRWRQQMGQPQLSNEEIAALPRKPLLGGEAAFITIDGTFSGMGNIEPRENFRLYGLARITDTHAYFVKMTGPQDVLAPREEEFLAFAASIIQGPAPAEEAPAPAEEAAPAPETPAASADSAPAPMARAFDPALLRWTAPEGWQDGGPRTMRLVTYEKGDAECYISVLPGSAGGVAANINRWVGQMGAAPLDDAALQALPQIDLLSTKPPLVEVAGDLTTMAGEQKPNYKLLGTLVSLDTHMVFVKLTGPADQVDAEKQSFIDFCASIHLADAQ